jgi:hypothetical protein
VSFRNDTGRIQRRWIVLGATLLALALALGAVGGAWLLRDHPIRAGIDGCMDVREPAPRIACLQDRALETAREDGEASAMRQLRAAAGREHSIECHLAMHQLGERAGRRDGEDGFEGAARDVRLSAGEPCDQGWIHGYLSVVFDDIDDASLARALTACAKVATRVGECDHALGHAFERAHRRDDEDDAVHRCELLASTTTPVDPDQTAASRVHDCRHGAVMESALLDATKAHPVVDRCRDVRDDSARTACYEFLVARARLQGDPWQHAARRSASLESDRDRSACDGGFIAAAPDRATCDVHPDRRVRAACRAKVRA